jgi:mannose-binding lectin 1
MLEDVMAGNIQSQQDQFADLHNRIQIMSNRLFDMADKVETMHKENEQRWNELMHRIVPIDDRGAATVRNVEKVERTTMQILRDLESKDFKDMMNQIHRALENNREGLKATLPIVMGDSKF